MIPQRIQHDTTAYTSKNELEYISKSFNLLEIASQKYKRQAII